MLSDEDKVPDDGKKVIVEPDTEKDVSGDWIMPFRLTSICKADSGTNATESKVKLYVFVEDVLIASNFTKFPTAGSFPIYAINYPFGYLSLTAFIVSFQPSIPL
jgi:hypothetical protein